MVIVFSILLYPLFFLLIFALAEYLLPTRNSAMLFSLAMALAASGLYYLLRSRAQERNRQKESERSRTETLRCRAMLLSPTVFSSFFPQDALCDNGSEAVSESALLSFLRKHPGQKTISVFALGGVGDKASGLANKLRLDLKIQEPEAILRALPEEILPPLAPIPTIPRKSRLIRAVRSPAFEKSTRHYGIFFLFYSLLTPFRVYYRFFGLFLIGLSLIIRYDRKKNGQKAGHQSTKSNSRSPI